jgi:hypothetical protein
MDTWDELLTRWTIEAGLGFDRLPDPATLRPKVPLADVLRGVDVLRANEELTRQNPDYWAALDARRGPTYK